MRKKTHHLDDFQFANRVRLINRFLQILFSLSLLVGLIYFCSFFAFRLDIGEQHRYTLSAETLTYLENIREPISISVTFSAYDTENQTEAIYKDVQALLREYAFASHQYKQPLTIEFIDPVISRQKIEKLAAAYSISVVNKIIISSPYGYEIILPSDLYQIQENGQMLFLGEQVLTSAIVRLSQDKKPVLYFLQGHGEPNLDNVDPYTGISELQIGLQARGVEARSLNLVTQNIPEDAALLVVIAPQYPYLQEEIDKMRRYLEEKNGRLLIAVTPLQKHGLDGLFDHWGIMADHAFVVDIDPQSKLSGGDLLIRRFSQHPITEPLIQYQLTVLTGLAGPVRPDPSSLEDPHRRIMPLMASSSQSWAERIHKSNLSNDRYNPQEGDLLGPVPLGCAVEKSTNSHLGVTIQLARLVVFGTTDWLFNHRIGLFGNQLLFWNACQWLLGRPKIAAFLPKTSSVYQLPIGVSELFNLFYILMLPGIICALFGIFVYYKRRY